jgi:hypothetical protein
VSPVTVAECRGLWRRTLLVTPEGVRDTTPGVRWLQADTVYVDSRGFAGTLHARDGVFTWHRAIDLEPPADDPDEGEMHWEADVLVERGVHADYVEHWVRDRDAQPCGAAVLQGPAGRSGLLVRAGAEFGLALDGRVVVDLVDGPRWPPVSGDGVDIDGTTWTVIRTEGQAPW